MMLNFLLDVRDKASDADWARYALAIYRSKRVFKDRPRSFKDWLPKFCVLFGKHVDYRAPSDIDRTKCEYDISVFLPK